MMKQKICAIIVLMALLIGIFPFSASAAQSINSVALTDLRLPEAEDPLDLHVEVEGSGYSLVEVEWYDVTAQKFLVLGDKFTLGHAYRASIYLEAKSGYEFAYADKNTPTVTATVDGNSKNVTVGKVYEYNAWARICVNYEFSTCPNDWIESVEATVIPPVADSPLVHSVTVPANAKYEVQMVEPNNSTHYYRFYNGIQWNIEFQSGVLEGTTAQLGKWYCASVLLKPKAGYAFLENGNIKATINGKEAQINDPTSDANLLEFSYSGFETFGRIPAFNVSIAEPVVGEYPYFYANAEVANVAVDNNNLRWVDRTANKYMTAYDVFEAGHEYEIIFEIKTVTGYRFMKDFDSSYVKVNNAAADVGSISATDDVIRVYKTYVIDSRTPVKNVVATANTQAILYDFGQYLTPSIIVNEGAPAKIESIRWESYYPGAWDGDRWVGAQWELMPSSAQFRIDKNYRLVAQLRIDGAAGSTHYLCSPTVRINNDLWEVGPVTVESNYSYVWITSPTMVPAAYEDAQTFKVTFDSKGGSAVPAITGVYYAKSIVRPADPVRSGYTFKGWYKDAAYTALFRFEGENGKNRIYEDCTLYAKWEAKAPSNPCANGHTFGAYVYNNDATSQKDGTKTRTCSVCKKTETVTAAGTKRTNPFVDVKKSDYFYAQVLWAVEKEITNGIDATHFAPENGCTRGQVVTFLWRAAGKPKPASKTNPFVDVKKDAYYYDAVLWAVEKGITNGMDATHFAPDATCTRGQIVTFLYRAAGKPKVSGSNPFTDVKMTDYFYDAVLWAVKNEITNGVDATHFAPASTCTRGQVVTFLYRKENNK